MKTPYETPEAELIRVALEKNILSINTEKVTDETSKDPFEG